MRSLLFVPGNDRRKLDKALASGADCVICDLEDSVSATDKPAARAETAAFLAETRKTVPAPLLYVRVNAFDTGMTDADLAAVTAARPDGIMLPKSVNGADVGRLAAMLRVHEAEAGLDDGIVSIIAICTESAAAVFGTGTYAEASPRLAGMTWGAEDLSADIGALAVRSESGDYTDPYRLARSMTLLGAVAAGVDPIDTVFVDFRDPEGLEAECIAAARDGFTGKMAIHPAQVEIINRAFTPDAASIGQAERIVAAFRQAGESGVTSLDGRMLDRPHLKRAEKLLARAHGKSVRV